MLVKFLKWAGCRLFSMRIDNHGSAIRDGAGWFGVPFLKEEL